MEKPIIHISPEVKAACPELRLGCIMATVEVQAENPELWNEISNISEDIHERLRLEDIARLAPVKASRQAYKALGKDPARYRLSAEALLRRVIRGLGLYQINNVVDCINLTSVKTGFSIGGYDMQKVIGEVSLGVGREGEPYQAIGRGELNIAYLPVFRDEKGAFGTPTSDSVRTSITHDCHQFWMPIFDFSGDGYLQSAMNYGADLLDHYGNASDIEKWIVS